MFVVVMMVSVGAPLFFFFSLRQRPPCIIRPCCAEGDASCAGAFTFSFHLYVI